MSRFGLSQVLPVVVQLVGNTNKTILIEQPEIHLHPKMQARLADIILRSVQENENRVIVETHSEHILLRFERRLRQAAGTSPECALAVFYVAAVDGEAQVTQLRLDQSGRVADPWPDGFFDEKLEDLLV
jgi:predicted ATPase